MSCDTAECGEPEWATGPIQLLSKDQGCLGEEERRGKEEGRGKGRWKERGRREEEKRVDQSI